MRSILESVSKCPEIPVENPRGKNPTLGDLHFCDGLPAVHCHKPCVVFLAAAQVQDQLGFVTSQSGKNRLQSFERKFA